MSEVSDAIGKAMHSEDLRPADCTMRLRAEGKAAPKSGCASCHMGGMFGCPHDGSRRKGAPEAPESASSKPDHKDLAQAVRGTISTLNKQLREAGEAGLKVHFDTMTVAIGSGIHLTEVTVDISLKL